MEGNATGFDAVFFERLLVGPVGYPARISVACFWRPVPSYPLSSWGMAGPWAGEAKI